jgi:hypothetical protein
MPEKEGDDMTKEEVARREQCDMCGFWYYATEMVWSELENLFICRTCFQIFDQF